MCVLCVCVRARMHVHVHACLRSDIISHLKEDPSKVILRMFFYFYCCITKKEKNTGGVNNFLGGAQFHHKQMGTKVRKQSHALSTGMEFKKIDTHQFSTQFVVAFVQK